jgi:hypothetical protein
VGSGALAQDKPADEKMKPMADQTKPAGDQMDKMKMKSMTMTGCLAKGADADGFMLNNAMAAGTAKDMAKDKPGAMAEKKSYHVMASGDVKLAPHVGHQVELTGHVDMMPKGTSGEGGKAEMPHFTVTGMKHVSPTCTQ